MSENVSVKSKKVKFKQLVKLFDDLKKDQIFLFILSMLSVSVSLYFAYQIQELVDVIVSGVEVFSIMSVFLKMLVLGGITFVLGILQTRYWHIFRYKTMNQMRMLMHKKLLEKEAIFFDGKTTGDVVSAIMADGSLIAECAGTGFLMFFLNIWQILFILIVLLKENLVLGSFVFFVGAIYFICINLINKRMKKAYFNFSTETAELNQRIVEDTKAIFEIKTLNEKNYFDKIFNVQIRDKYFPAAKAVIKLDVLTYSVNQFINIIFPMFILVMGGVFASKNMLTIGSVVLFYTYTQKLVEPLNNLSDFYRGTQVAVGVSDRVYDYLFEERKEHTADVSGFKKDISLKLDINTFGWKEENELFHDIHEEYVSGDKVFVQGESGTGKSSLLKLLCGFYDISDGKIQINGLDIRKIKEEQRFDYIKIQFQEPIILEGSLRENLELGKHFSDEELLEALKMVNMEKFVFENGWEYAISENGKNLSGGQKQRLALARVILRKPYILILDEATSALDEKNEEIIVRRLEEYIEQNGGILIITSHRNALKQICNKMLILEK